jgi:hypothetical protein
MERIRFFSIGQLNVKKNEAIPLGEEVRITMDGGSVSAIMGEPMPLQMAAGFADSLPMAIGELAAELDGIESEYTWLKEGPVFAAFMSSTGPLAQGATPIDALINLAKTVQSFDGWVPDLEEE